MKSVGAEIVRNEVRPITVWRRFASQRLAHAFCVGTAKSGTHSINSFVREPLTAAHELEKEQTISLILKANASKTDRQQINRFLVKRDRKYRLDIDSSQLNYFFLDALVSLFPKSRFILTVREPRAWLDSFVNHQLGRTVSPNWQKLRDMRFRPDKFAHRPEDAPLKARGLYSLDGYLSYWREHNLRVPATVPSERLLILRTREIQDSIPRIARFLSIDAGLLDANRAHAFPAAGKFNVLDLLEPRYLDDRIAHYTHDVMSDLFV